MVWKGKAKFGWRRPASQSSAGASSSGEKENVAIPSRESPTFDNLTLGSLSKVGIPTENNSNNKTFVPPTQSVRCVYVMSGSQQIGTSGISENTPVYAKHWMYMADHKQRMNRTDVSIEFGPSDLALARSDTQACDVHSSQADRAAYECSPFQHKVLKALGDAHPAFSQVSQKALTLSGASDSAPPITGDDIRSMRVTVLHTGDGEIEYDNYTPSKILWFLPYETGHGFHTDTEALQQGDKPWTGPAFYLLDTTQRDFRPLTTSQKLEIRRSKIPKSGLASPEPERESMEGAFKYLEDFKKLGDRPDNEAPHYM